MRRPNDGSLCIVPIVRFNAPSQCCNPMLHSIAPWQRFTPPLRPKIREVHVVPLAPPVGASPSPASGAESPDDVAVQRD